MNYSQSLILCVLDKYVKKSTKSGRVLDGGDGFYYEYAKLLQKGLGVNALIRAVKSNAIHRCDILVSGTPANVSSAHRVSFPFQLSRCTFASRRPGLASDDPWKFTRVFSPQVWIGLALALVVVAVTHHFLRGSGEDRPSPPHDSKKKTLKVWTRPRRGARHPRQPARNADARRNGVFSSLYSVLCPLLGFSNTMRSTRAQKVLFAFWIVVLAFLVLFFASVLLSVLTVPHRERGLETIDDVYQGILEGKVRAVSNLGNGIGQVLSVQRSHEKAQVIGRDILANDQINFLTRDLQKNEAAFGTDLELRLCFGDQDRYQISGATFLDFWLSFPFLNTSRHVVERLNQVVVRIWSMGFSARREDIGLYQVRLRDSRGSPEDDPVRPLTLSDLSSAFYCWIAGLCVAAFTLVLEICASKFWSRR